MSTIFILKLLFSIKAVCGLRFVHFVTNWCESSFSTTNTKSCLGYASLKGLIPYSHQSLKKFKSCLVKEAHNSFRTGFKPREPRVSLAGFFFGAEKQKNMAARNLFCRSLFSSSLQCKQRLQNFFSPANLYFYYKLRKNVFRTMLHGAEEKILRTTCDR